MIELLFVLVVTRQSNCYAFIDGDIDRKEEYRFNGHILLIEDVVSRNVFGWKPRRCGGGLGGSERPFKQPFHINKQIKQRKN